MDIFPWIDCILPIDADSGDIIGVAGEWLPRVHFTSVGYAVNGPYLEETTVILPEINIESVIEGSNEGGLLFTLPGNFYG